MKLRILQSFSDKLNGQVAYIAKDKPDAARKFKSIPCFGAILFRILAFFYSVLWQVYSLPHSK